MDLPASTALISEEPPKAWSFLAGPWLALIIVGLALALRIAWLGIKPAHFDEGVNGWFVDEMTRDGFYHYDPSNFHGPLHFYVLFLAQTLFGRDVWILRMPIVLVSTGCVAMIFAYRRFFGSATCTLAALAMAVSPGMVFYGRYAIHESWLVLFLMLTAWGILSLYQERTKISLWAVGLGITGMILTKETYVIHGIALLLAIPTLLLVEAFSPSAPCPPRPPRRWTHRDLAICIASCCGLIVFFYTGGLLDWPDYSRLQEDPPRNVGSLAGLYETFLIWTRTGMAGESGHEKEWFYWLELLARYEWPAAFGLLLSPLVLKAHVNRALRYLTIAGVGTLVAYSIIQYKTPWCLLPIIWPFYFVLGKALVYAVGRLDRWIVGSLMAILIGGSFLLCLRLNFRDYADEEEPYVYVQTLPDIRKLTDPLLALAAADPANYHLPGHLLLPSNDLHPLPWMLADFPKIGFGDDEQIPAQMDVAVLLVEDAMVSDVEERLRESYFKEPFILRGSWGNSATLYLNTAIFGPLFPSRPPDFEPDVAAPAEPGSVAEQAISQDALFLQADEAQISPQP